MLKLLSKIRFVTVFIMVILLASFVFQPIHKAKGESIYYFPAKFVNLTRWREIIKIDKNGDGTIWTFVTIKFLNKSSPRHSCYNFVFNLQYHPITNLIVYPNKNYSDQRTMSFYLSVYNKTECGIEPFSHVKKYRDILYINVSLNASEKFEFFSFAFRYTIPDMAKEIGEHFESSHRWEIRHSIYIKEVGLVTLFDRFRLWISFPEKAYLQNVKGLQEYATETPMSEVEVIDELAQYLGYLTYDEWGGTIHSNAILPINFSIFNNSLLLYSRPDRETEFVIDYNIPNPENYERSTLSLYIAILSLLLSAISGFASIYLSIRRPQSGNRGIIYLLAIVSVCGLAIAYFLFSAFGKISLEFSTLSASILVAFLAGFVSSMISIFVYDKIETYRWEDVNRVFYTNFNNTSFLAFYKIFGYLGLIPPNFGESMVGDLIKKVGEGEKNNQILNSLNAFSVTDFQNLKDELETVRKELEEIIKEYPHKLRPKQYRFISEILIRSSSSINICKIIIKNIQRGTLRPVSDVFPLLAKDIEELCKAFSSYLNSEKKKFKKWGYT